MAAANTCRRHGSQEQAGLVREPAGPCCDSHRIPLCRDAASQAWLYLRITGCDIGQAYLSSHKVKAELASAIMAIIKSPRRGSSVRETGAKVPLMRKA